MIKRLAWMVLVSALGLGAPSANAQSTASLVLFGSAAGPRPVSTTEVPAQFTGMLAISFHGDPSTGCAGQGLCAYSGTVLVAPSSGGAVGVATYGAPGHRSYQAALSLGGAPGGALTAAHIR